MARLGILLLLSLACMHVQAVSIEERWRDASEQYPFLGRLRNIFAEETVSKEEPVEEGEEDKDYMKHYLRMLFRNWNFQGTPMFDILRTGELPDLTALSEKMSVVKILERLETDPELQKQIVLAYAEQLKNEKQNPATSEDDVTGYESCKRDYSSLAEPFTNGLIGRAIDLVNSTMDNLLPPWFPTPDLPQKPPEKSLERWGWAMFDSLTKIPEGITDGKLHWVGAYEKCNSIHAVYNYTDDRASPPIFQAREFDALYCRLDFNPKDPLIGNGVDYTRLQMGICVPNTCSRTDIAKYLTSYREGNLILAILLNNVMGLRLDKVYCGQETDYATDSAIKAAVGIIVSLILIVVAATVYDGFFRVKIMKRYVDGLAKKGQMAIQRSISQISTGVVQGLEAEPTIEASTSSAPTTPEPPVTSLGGDPGFSAKPTGAQRQTSTTSIGSYHPVHATDYRKYSIKKGNNNSNNSNGNDSNSKGSNGNNNNDSGYLNHPSLGSQMSTGSRISTAALMPEVAAVQQEVERPSVLDRLEVFFVGFSAYSNLSRVFNTREGPELELPSLSGIRTLSWMYALYGHVWLFGPLYNESWTTGNLIRALRYYPRLWSFQPIINFHFSSDAFFVISGCLVSYYWLKKVEEKGGISIRFMIRYYFYRYWSLMPALMLVLMTYTTTYRYLGSGPLFPPNVGDADNCRREWWTDLLLMHNIINPDHMCLTWTWYVGILWQLYVLTPLFLVPFIFKRWLGYLSLAALYIIHLGAAAGVSANLYSDDEKGIVAWFKEYFLTPWCRAGPYAVGLVLGVILSTNKKIKIRINPILVVLGWIAALTLICTVEYATYSIFKEGGARWDKATRVLYETFSRTAFGLGVAWIAFACETGHGGFINSILSWRVFLPLGRIVYPSYLMHAMMVFTFVYGQYNLLYLNSFNVLYWFFSHIWVVHIVGIFYVGLLFHWPLSSGVIRVWRVRTKLDCVRAGRHEPIPETAYDVTAAARKQWSRSGSAPHGILGMAEHVYENVRHRFSPSPHYDQQGDGTTAF